MDPIERFVVLTWRTYGGIRGSIPTFATRIGARVWGEVKYSANEYMTNWRVFPVHIYPETQTYALVTEDAFAGAWHRLPTFPCAIEALKCGKSEYRDRHPRAVCVLAEPPIFPVVDMSTCPLDIITRLIDGLSE